MINKKLKALRAQHGMTRKDLADEVNVSKQTICAIKKGIQQTLELWIRIYKVFGVTLDDLFWEE